MNIVDYVFIGLIILFGLKGLKNGAIKEVVSLVGGVIVLIVAFELKNPVSVYMYKHLPFFNLGGLLNGISVLNVIIYELIAFVLVASILMIIYKLVISLTSIIEKIIKITVILEIPSKIIGLLLGLVEGFLFSFIVLFLAYHIDYSRNMIIDSRYGMKIMNNTPYLSKNIKPLTKASEKIIKIANDYKDEKNRDEANAKALDVLLKYKIISKDNAEYLIDTGKLKIKNVDKVIEKY